MAVLPGDLFYPNETLTPEGAVSTSPDLAGAASIAFLVSGDCDLVPYEVAVDGTVTFTAVGDATQPATPPDLAGAATVTFTAVGDASFTDLADLAGAASIAFTAVGDVEPLAASSLAGDAVIVFTAFGAVTLEAPTFTPALVAVGVHP